MNGVQELIKLMNCGSTVCVSVCVSMCVFQSYQSNYQRGNGGAWNEMTTNKTSELFSGEQNAVCLLYIK